jgi:AmmeMemoRadiSam system protein B
VISSDIHHFASEATNRKLDRLALDAMLTGDPRKLYDTCMAHDISMCGLMAAVMVMEALRLDTPQLKVEFVDYSNSAAAAGDASRVVGYGGVLIE